MSFAEIANALAGQAGLFLGWRPDEFWSATPAELCAILGAAQGSATAAPDAQTLSALMELFPDG